MHRRTTPVAFEWSSQPDSKNLHYNVFSRDDGPERVFTAFDSVHCEDLTNDIGDTQLSAVGMDPDFDPSQHTVYYAPVIEIPTPRWTAYDAECFGVTMSR
mgnify:FL=1